MAVHFSHPPRFKMIVLPEEINRKQRLPRPWNTLAVFLPFLDLCRSQSMPNSATALNFDALAT
jgi:hypothetical protein